MPRQRGDYADVQTDIFAAGSCIFHIMMGHELFPDLDEFNDEEEIERRFEDGEFPTDQHVCENMCLKCWKQIYGSVDEVVGDVSHVQAMHTSRTLA